MNAGGISEKGREIAAANREEFKRKKFGSFKGNRIKTDSNKYMSYPVARGPNDETGDTLLIKCVKYQPPSPETDTTGVSGLATFAPIAVGNAQPRLPE